MAKHPALWFFIGWLASLLLPPSSVLSMAKGVVGGG